MFTSLTKREIKHCCFVNRQDMTCYRRRKLPNIHIQIHQTININRFPLRISRENLVKDQNIFPLVIIFLILIIFSFDDVLMSWRENWCWSLLEVERLNCDVVETSNNVLFLVNSPIHEYRHPGDQRSRSLEFAQRRNCIFTFPPLNEYFL